MTISPRRIQRRYDHRLRELVQTSGDVELAVRRGVPRSTARGWLTSTPIDVVTLDFLDLETVRLQHELSVLRRRIAQLVSLLRLLVTVLKVTDLSFSRIRLPEGSAKLQLLQAIERTRPHFRLRAVLRMIGLSHARYHGWKREDVCGNRESEGGDDHSWTGRSGT